MGQMGGQRFKENDTSRVLESAQGMKCIFNLDCL